MKIVTEWFNQAKWNEGVSINIDSNVNIPEFYNQYQKCPDLWKMVFEYLKQDLSSVAVGRYALKENELMANISEYETKEPEDAKWEAHRKYIDLQYVICGEEKMGILPLNMAVSPEEYQEEQDLIFFGEQNGGTYLHATPDVYFLLFPSDVHRPGLQLNEPKRVKKLVLKIAFL